MLLTPYRFHYRQSPGGSATESCSSQFFYFYPAFSFRVGRFKVFIDLPIWFAICVSGVLGLLIGSFLNVVVARVPRGLSIVRPASQCPGCGQSIRWYDNFPVLSYLFLKGKCRTCKEPISIRYPVIEILTSIMFIAVQLRLGISWHLLFRDWPFVAILLAITFIDLEHGIIPDVLSLGGLILGLATCWMVDTPGWLNSWLGAGIGFSAFYALAWIYYKISGRAGLGGGDIKLLAMLGAFVGPYGVLTTVLISSVFGSLVGIGWALATQKKGLMKMSIPYGPFLVLGALYYYLLGDTLWFQFTIPM
jgi:leader peptidase (prepilin peptidase)/N-methyltransferase